MRSCASSLSQRSASASIEMRTSAAGSRPRPEAERLRRGDGARRGLQDRLGQAAHPRVERVGRADLVEQPRAQGEVGAEGDAGEEDLPCHPLSHPPHHEGADGRRDQAEARLGQGERLCRRRTTARSETATRPRPPP